MLNSVAYLAWKLNFPQQDGFTKEERRVSCLESRLDGVGLWLRFLPSYSAYLNADDSQLQKEMTERGSFPVCPTQVCGNANTI